METEAPIDFLDLPLLLSGSEPQPRLPWFGIALAGSVILLVGGLVAGNAAGTSLQLIASLALAAIFLTLPFVLRFRAKAIREEQSAVQTVMECVQLRRWPEAAAAVRAALGKPARSFALRNEALVYLSAILSRYHRFEDAIAVQNYLIDGERVPPIMAYGLKLGRAMAMLREDHLVDADQAISALRRNGPENSAGLALVEMYRHVKTGHPEDALAVFQNKIQIFRDQLGHRAADAYALAARAFDLLNRNAEAADAFTRATLLAPAIELYRRYPEVERMAGRYQPASAPPEMA